MPRHIFDSMFFRLFAVFGGIVVCVQTVSYLIFVKSHEPAGFTHLPTATYWGSALLIQLGPPLLSAVLAARILARPFRLLARGAADIAKNIDAPPIPVVGPAEVRHAAQVCNQMQLAIRQQLSERNLFLAAVSHDLRTPLTRMKLRLRSSDQTNLHEKLLDDIGEMTQLVDATLSFLRNGELIESYSRMDINALVHAITEDAVERGQDVTVEGFAGPMFAQPLALKRCLTNLVSNAVRYGDRARIKVVDTREYLQISIADNGPGISEAHLERVFEPFYRIEASRSKETGGIGLGLSIARDVALRHRGTLTLSNGAPGGLVATLWFPRNLGRAPKPSMSAVGSAER
jgi:signal transduction histidine kinase